MCRALEEESPNYKKLQTENMLIEEHYRKQINDLAAKLQVLEADKRKLEEEGAQRKRLVEELVGLVECPVCLVVPRQPGPVPVCPNGHFICRSCRDLLRQEAGLLEAKCPSCTTNLGDATSILASRLVENVKHQCENFGCEEMVALADFEAHLRVCQFRQVLCPGSGAVCKLLLPFNQVEQHVANCGNQQFKHQGRALENRDTEIYTVRRGREGELLYWRTSIVKAHGKMFFCKMKRDQHTYFWEVVMLGDEEESKNYRATLSLLENNDEVIFAMAAFPPRPISQIGWEQMGFYVPEKNLAWSSVEDDYLKINLRISIDKIR